MNALKNEITEFIKQALNLPDNAVITRGSVQITDQDEVIIIGATSVDYQHFEINQESEVNPSSLLIKREYKKRGSKGGLRPRENGNTIKKKRESAEFITPAKGSALVGAGAKITESQIKGWKAALWARRQGGLLSDTQIAAIDALKGTFARNLTPEQKQQVKDIFEETTPKRY